jgi:hypothetical protein
LVVEKIKTDPTWRMWTALAAVLIPLFGYMTWSHGQMIEHIDLKMAPLVMMVEANTKARNKGGRYTEKEGDDDREQYTRLCTVERSAREAGDARLHVRMDSVIERIFTLHGYHETRPAE